MTIKVVKPKQLIEDEKAKEPTSEAQLTFAVQSWVKEFRTSKETSRKANIWQSQKS